MSVWIAAGAVVFLLFNFLLIIGVLAASSALDDFNREADDRDQIEYIRRWYEKKEDRQKAKEQRRNARRSAREKR